MTKLYLVRHGPTNRKGLIGWTDVPVDLSETARLKALNEHLPNLPVVSSDLKRASMTADGFAGQRRRLDHDNNLREFHFGDWEDKSVQEVETAHPELAKNYWSEPGEHAPPNGESWDQGYMRMSNAIDGHLEEQGDIIIVCHMGVILTQIARATKMPAQHALSFKIDNYSVTTLERLKEPYWRVLGVNHIY